MDRQLPNIRIASRVFAAIGVALTILAIGAGVYFVAFRTGSDSNIITNVERKAAADGKAEADRIAAEKAAAAKTEADRLAAQKVEADRLAAQKAEADRLAAEKAEADRLAAQKAEADRIAAQKAAEAPERKAAAAAPKWRKRKAAAQAIHEAKRRPHRTGEACGYICGVGDGGTAVSKPPSPRLSVLETGYSFLKVIGGEKLGYGLYSYAILVNDSDRSAKFLSDVFGVGFNAIPPVEETAAPPSQKNTLYIPLKRNKAKEWSDGLKLGNEASLRAAYAKNFYDYKLSRALLDHLCDSPAEDIRTACEGDLSRGPFIFAYAKPASKLSPVPPPFLFMDLSDVHERAFPEIIAAFKAQVKREDISDGERIHTLRLTLLNIALTAADWLVPVQKAVADIVYSASGQGPTHQQNPVPSPTVPSPILGVH
jgi:hypothetical protein